jgi:hypothetical protein
LSLILPENFTVRCLHGQVEFDITMTVSSEVCKGKEGVIERPVELQAAGLNEKLTLNLKIMCSCQCEMPGMEVG